MKKNGFTLLELIIVVAIIGIFAVVIMPIINGNWANNEVSDQQSRKAHVIFENGVWQSCANGSCYPIDNPHVFQQETESE